MKRKNIVCLTAIAISVLCSCQKDSVSMRKSIRVNVIGGASFTKGAAMTTNSLKTGGRFVLDAYLDDYYRNYSVEETAYKDPADAIAIDPDTDITERHYINSNGAYNVQYSATKWSTATEYMWVANDVTRFWCRWPEDAAVNEASEGIRTITTAPGPGATTMEFTYSLPTHVAGSDADNQKDILFAYSQRNYPAKGINGEEDGDVNIKFNHPLSQINFCISPNDATFDVSLSIERIAVKQVYPQGSCVYNALGKIQPTGSEASMFVWTPSGTKADYSQDYNVTFGSLPSGWTEGTYKKSSTETYRLFTCENSFMMIPQTLASGTVLEVTFGNTGTGSDITVSKPINGTTWLPGHYYTYKIGATTVGRSISMIVILDEWGHFEDKLLM